MRSEIHDKLIELLGEDMALRLIELHGGTQLYIAVGPNVGKLRLAHELSPAAEIAMARGYGAGNLKIPLAKRWRARIYRSRGLTHREIARRLGCTERAVVAYLQPETTSLQMTMPF